MQETCNDIRDINLDVVEKTYRTNILSMFAMRRFALPHIKRGASIINSWLTYQKAELESVILI